MKKKVLIIALAVVAAIAVLWIRPFGLFDRSAKNIIGGTIMVAENIAGCAELGENAAMCTEVCSLLDSEGCAESFKTFIIDPCKGDTNCVRVEVEKTKAAFMVNKKLPEVAVDSKAARKAAESADKKIGEPKKGKCQNLFDCHYGTQDKVEANAGKIGEVKAGVDKLVATELKVKPAAKKPPAAPSGKKPASSEGAELHNKAVALYNSRDWQGLCKIIGRLMELDPNNAWYKDVASYCASVDGYAGKPKKSKRDTVLGATAGTLGDMYIDKPLCDLGIKKSMHGKKCVLNPAGLFFDYLLWDATVNLMPKKIQDNVFGKNRPVPPPPAPSGPTQPNPNDPGPGTGADAGGYGGTVADTTGNQNYTNTSVGLTQVSSSTVPPPPMAFGAVDMPGQIVQGQSGTPVFAPIGSSSGTSTSTSSGGGYVGPSDLPILPPPPPPPPVGPASPMF